MGSIDVTCDDMEDLIFSQLCQVHILGSMPNEKETTNPKCWILSLSYEYFRGVESQDSKFIWSFQKKYTLTKNEHYKGLKGIRF